MKLGVMQGRLSLPVNGHYQEFPENWKQEFSALSSLGLAGVEWLITKGSVNNNPLMFAIENKEDFPIISICMDTLVDNRINDEGYVNEALENICSNIANKFEGYLTIPLLDESSLENNEKRKQFCSIIQKIGERHPDVKFAFEAELSIEKLKEIIELNDNFFVTYDTGNITSHGVDHVEYINAFASKIVNVHIKDRTYSAKTVEPLTGDTNFDIIFKTLSEVGYKGSFILQTARSEDGQELQTIERHKKIFEDLHAKYF